MGEGCSPQFALHKSMVHDQLIPKNKTSRYFDWFSELPFLMVDLKKKYCQSAFVFSREPSCFHIYASHF